METYNPCTVGGQKVLCVGAYARTPKQLKGGFNMNISLVLYNVSIGKKKLNTKLKSKLYQ